MDKNPKFLSTLLDILVCIRNVNVKKTKKPSVNKGNIDYLIS